MDDDIYIYKLRVLFNRKRDVLHKEYNKKLRELEDRAQRELEARVQLQNIYTEFNAEMGKHPWVDVKDKIMYFTNLTDLQETVMRHLITDHANVEVAVYVRGNAIEEEDYED